jgi:pSer/pThr/pTyr-binding forkhead associated (FHA) protein
MTGAGKTRKLVQDRSKTDTAVPEIKAIDLGMPRPWRIALRLVQQQVQMIFDLEGKMIVGRAYPDSGYYPDIDLGAFNAGDLGVSREHLFIQLDGDRVVIEDNHSANGTKLNGEWLKPHEKYPVRNGDEIMLGLMKVQVELLTNLYN